LIAALVEAGELLMLLAGRIWLSCGISQHANIVDCACRLVLKGTYCGVEVAVCRIMPASSTIYKSIFGVSAKQNAAAALRTGGAATNKGRPRRASASRGKSKERGSPLLEAQVVTSKTQHLSASGCKPTGSLLSSCGHMVQAASTSEVMYVF